MNSLVLFMIEVLLCFGISVSLIYLLKPLLLEVLVDICGTRPRAEFWVMFTQLMLIISPLLIVIFFAPTQSVLNINIAEAIKYTLFRSLLGDFIALAMIGQIIWQSIKISPNQSATKTDSHSNSNVMFTENNG